MEPIIAITFTRVGLMFDFLAFFLAAPELLGENGLKKILKPLRVILWWFGSILFLISLLGVISFIITFPLMFIEAFKELLSHQTQLDIYLFNFSIFSVKFTFISALLSWLPIRVMKLGELLSNSNRARRLLLNIGVLFFAGGAIAQFIGTF